jgi:hypothetical protein
MTIDEVVNEVSKEWSTGKWTSIVIAIGEAGNPRFSFVGGASRRDNGLENGRTRRALRKAIQEGYKPVGIVATSNGRTQHLLPLAGSGFSVGKDPKTGKESFERYHTDA